MVKVVVSEVAKRERERERGSDYKLWLSYFLHYGVFGIIH